MGPCCDAKRKCLANAKQLGGADGQKMAFLCDQGWKYWKAANRDALEQRAAAQSCAEAKKDIGIIDSGKTAGWDIPCNCRDILVRERDIQCPHGDANAALEGCPFDANGDIDQEQYLKLMKIARGLK